MKEILLSIFLHLVFITQQITTPEDIIKQNTLIGKITKEIRTNEPIKSYQRSDISKYFLFLKNRDIYEVKEELKKAGYELRWSNKKNETFENMARAELLKAVFKFPVKNFNLILCERERIYIELYFNNKNIITNIKAFYLGISACA